jgi:DNA-binding MarR family transcriptional regulator
MKQGRNEDFIDFISSVSKSVLLMKSFLRKKIKASNLDLTFEMVQVLKTLWNKENINQQEIANVTQKDKASLTYLIDNLTKRNLVVRTEDKSDRRNKLITLTPKGAALKDVMQPWFEDMYAVSGHGITPELLSAGKTVFQQMISNLENNSGN